MDVSVVFGVLGNIVASLLFLSPLDTFWRILKNRSTEEFESIPYTVLLMNASLWTYYGLIKPDVPLLTINGFGSLMMIIFLTIFLIYAPPKMKVRTGAFVVVMNVGFFVGIIVVTRLTMDSEAQVDTIGILCDFVTIISFASPLAAMKTVVKTKSVEFMPFALTFCYFLVATIWSIYGILIHDIFVMIPNGIGFMLGVAQLVLYAWYRKPRPSKPANGGTLEDGDQHQHLIVNTD